MRKGYRLRSGEQEPKAAADEASSAEEESESPWRRNFALGVANGALMTFSLGFIDPYSVLPVFILKLTSSYFLVGAASSMFRAGWLVPQFFVSRFLEARRRRLPIYRLMAAVRVGALGLASIVLLTARGGDQGAIFLLFFVLYVVWSVSAGFAGVPFMDVVTRTITVRRRGRFFGIRRFLGTMLAALAGILVARILSGGSWRFPAEYGILFLISTGVSAVGLFSFCLVREPPEREVRSVPLSFKQHVLEAGRFLKTDLNYRRYFVVRVLWMATVMALPFYSAYGIAVLGMKQEMAGVFVTIWMICSAFSNLLWGYLGDRFGTTVVIVLTSLFGATVPLIALAAAFILKLGTPEAARYVFLLTFAFNGLAFHGRQLGDTVYLLEISPASHRPTYIGLANTLTSPLAFLPALGGVIASLVSYEFLFAVVLLTGVLGAWMARRLVEPRIGTPLGHLTAGAAA